MKSCAFLLSSAKFDVILSKYNPEAGCKFQIYVALQSYERRVMPMNTMEVLTLLLVVFTALTYIDQHKKK